MIEEKGPWAAAFYNGKAFIESDDFTHDVRLCVSGDFESVEQKVEYAEEIARRLNTFASRDAEIAEVVAALKLATTYHEKKCDCAGCKALAKVRKP